MVRVIFFSFLFLMPVFSWSAELGLNDNQQAPNNSLFIGLGLEDHDYENSICGSIVSQTQVPRTIRRLRVAVGAECEGPHTITNSVFNYLVLSALPGQIQPFRLQNVHSLQGVELHLYNGQFSDDLLLLENNVSIGPNGNQPVEVVFFENDDEESDDSDNEISG